VKIDRSLIANIDINHKTQKIVAGIIDFLHASGYLALAEGVETSAELETMINLSADLIQGYYVSRPKPVLLHEISKNIRDEIVQINIKAKDNVQRIYQPTEGEEIDICMLAVEKYTDIFVDVENIKLIGSADRQVPLGITVKDNAHCEIVMKNVNITSHADTPTVTLGTNSSAVIICDGDNKLCQRGIFVPRSSDLTLLGAGSLSIEAESYNCYAIGNDCDHSYGNITVGMTGKLLISANGENSVGIGGGKNVDGSMIRIISGDISLRCTGGTSVGIGSHSDNALIEISDCRCSIKLASTSAVAIGAVTGKADIKLRNFKIECESAGICNTAVGVIKEGTGNVDISEGRLSVNMRGKRLYCVGTNGGSVNCTLENVKTDFYCEGSVVSGIGDMSGSGDVRIKDSGISMTFLTGEGMALGSPGGKLETVGGVRDIKINE
jgi:hypothetical protein